VLHRRGPNPEHSVDPTRAGPLQRWRILRQHRHSRNPRYRAGSARAHAPAGSTEAAVSHKPRPSAPVHSPWGLCVVRRGHSLREELKAGELKAACRCVKAPELLGLPLTSFSPTSTPPVQGVLRTAKTHPRRIAQHFPKACLLINICCLILLVRFPKAAIDSFWRGILSHADVSLYAC